MRVREQRSIIPQPGYFMMELRKGAPMTPARIYRACRCTIGGGRFNDTHDWTEDCDRSGMLVAEAAGREVDIEQVWHHGHRVTESEWRYQTDLLGWRRAHEPASPEASPDKVVRLDQAPPIF